MLGFAQPRNNGALTLQQQHTFTARIDRAAMSESSAAIQRLARVRKFCAGARSSFFFLSR
jgi:hypothetical protein